MVEKSVYKEKKITTSNLILSQTHLAHSHAKQHRENHSSGDEMQSSTNDRMQMDRPHSQNKEKEKRGRAPVSLEERNDALANCKRCTRQWKRNQDRHDASTEKH